MISWKNPTEADRDLGMDDYLELGLRAALAAVSAIVPKCKIHTGGLLHWRDATRDRRRRACARERSRIASLTTLAAQTDFSDPGELSLFISPSHLEMLEAVMHKAGRPRERQDGGILHDAALARSTLGACGKQVSARKTYTQMISWRGTPTALACLGACTPSISTGFFLHNELARGQFPVAGESIHLQSITVPLFVVGTETDHVAPWRSVYKMRALTRSADYTRFC